MRLLISALLLAVLAAPASALTQASQSTDGGVTIRASAATGAVLDPGDRVSFQYQSARDGALVVFDIDTQGYVTLLSDEPIAVKARENGVIPNDRSELFAEGEPGVEFVFAVAVADPSAIDSDAFASLRTESRRIDGDPFIAANMIAAELVSNISQHTVFMGYTYFYVSDRVEYPCYLCGTCDGSAGTSDCDGYRIVQNFDRGVSLSYPLGRGYDMVDLAGESNTTEDVATDVAMPTEDTDVNFYPYGSEVYYAEPVAMNAWYSWGWYDPFLWYYPSCYPYYYSPWSFSIGFGWGGWGYGYGGYYCSGYYDPWYGCGYYPSYPAAYPGTVSKFKSQYKSGSGAQNLSQNRQYAMKTDGELRVATKDVRSSSKTAAYRSSKNTMSKNPFVASSGHRVKTSVSGRSVTRETWAKGRNGVLYKGNSSNRSGKSMYRTRDSAGRTVMDRGGYRRGDSGAIQQQRGGSSRTKGNSTYAPRGTSTRSKSTWAPSQRSAPRSSGTTSAPRMGGGGGYKGSHGASSFRSGGSSGSRSMGGGMKGGGGRGGRGR